MRGILWLALAACPASVAAQTVPIDAAAIRADVQTLASDAFAGRGPGERGEERTLAFLKGEFERAGLKPGGPGGSWFQDVPLVRTDTSGRAMSARIGGRDVAMVAGRDFALQMSGEGAISIADAPVVFVGFGVEAPDLGWSDYAGADVAGKVVVMLANDPDYDRASGPFGGAMRSNHARGKARLAFDRGAAAVVTVHQRAATGMLWETRRWYAAEPAYRLASTPAPATPPQIVAHLDEPAARRLFAAAGADFARLEAAAKTPGFRAVALAGATMSLAATAKTRPFLTRNILARLDGTGRAGETVVFGAHWDAYGLGEADVRGDTIRNGAVDNAIGTATMLAVARAFARAPRTKRSLLFIGYTSEEDGLLGAYHYTRAPVVPLATTAAVFNLDPHLALPRTRSIELIGAGRTDLEDDFAEVVRGEGLAVEPEQLPDEQWYRRSDHLAFAEAGVPTVYFRAGRDLVDGGSARGTAWVADYDLNRYHQRNDVFDPRWDLAAAAQEGTVAYRLGRRIADGDRWPGWRATPAAAAYAAERAKTAEARR